MRRSWAVGSMSYQQSITLEDKHQVWLQVLVGVHSAWGTDYRYLSHRSSKPEILQLDMISFTKGHYFVLSGTYSKADFMQLSHVTITQS